MKYEAGTILYNGRKNILWGAGEKGFQTLSFLCEFGVYVDRVCDSNEKIQGLRFFNKRVVSPEDVLRESAEYNFIIAVEKEKYVKEIIDKLEQTKIKNYVIWKDICDKKYYEYIPREYLYGMICDSYVRRLVIYGMDEEGRTLRQFLEMLDVKVDFFLDDVENEYECMGKIVKPVYDLCYENKEDYKVIVTKNKTARTGILDKMGLQERVDYNLSNEYIYNRTLSKLYILDPNLGYNFWGRGSCQRPGFVEMGKESDFTIVLLGGSTTDGIMYPFPSWGKLLYEKFRKNGIEVRILNGGCAGYISSQELVKLIRDVIPLKPDVVIDYTGINDANNISQNHRFVNQHQRDLLEYITGEASEEAEGSGHPHYSRKAYTQGVGDDRPTWEVFMDHIKMMNAICSQQGICYLPFLQPSLVTKGKMSIAEQELVLNSFLLKHKEFFNGAWRQFYQELRQSEDSILEDVTGLFDDCDDIYLDVCHVTESGNDRIAQYMYEYLTGKGIVKA